MKHHETYVKEPGDFHYVSLPAVLLYVASMCSFGLRPDVVEI